MFYSHNYLGKKGPLGTVWIAAFLQHKLRKSHVIVIDIPSSVERIMLPEVPIALRLSGHLLVGIARIYSRKVDYLFHDCNEVLSQLRTAFASAQIDLPDDSTHAPFNLLTRPETFELDALTVGGLQDYEQTPDKHTRRFEDVTMEDPLSEERNLYVAISLEDEEEITLPSGNPENAVDQPMDIDTLPPFPRNFDMDLMGHNPATHEQGQETNLGSDMMFSHDAPEVEVLRDHVQTFETEIDPLIAEKHGSETREENGKSFSTPRRNLASEGEPILEHAVPAVGSADLPAFDLGEASGHAAGMHVASDLKILPTPQVENKRETKRKLDHLYEVKNKRGTKRKLDHLFNDSIVLKNDVMKDQLQDTSKLVRKRSKLPRTALGAWNFHFKTSMDQLLSKPSAVGMCEGLQEAFNKSFPRSSAEVPTTVEPSLDHGINEMPKDNVVSEGFHGMEDIEQFRSHVDVSPGFMDVEPFMSHSRMSPPGNDTIYAPTDATISPTLPRTPTNSSISPTLPRTGIHPTPDLMFPESTSIMDGTFMDYSRDDMTLRDDYSIPADFDDLNLVEPEGEELSDYSLTSRTRALARFLIKKSPAIKSTGSELEKLSLNKIMRGRTRNQCAKILFETLVLKSNQLIDVEQEEAYGDITLLLNPKVLSQKL